MADGAADVPRPSESPAMMAAAEELAHGFDFVRIDFYQPRDQPLFGQISFYPWSGLDPFDPPELDAEMGRLWLRAAASPRSGLRSRPLCPVTSPVRSSPLSARGDTRLTETA